MIVTESALVQKVSKANEYVLLYGESLKHSLQDEQMDAQAQKTIVCLQFICVCDGYVSTNF